METEHTFMQDLDNKDVFRDLSANLESPEVHNFVAQFDAQRALSSLNLTADQAQRLLDSRGQGETSTSCLWINLWGWNKDHEDIIKKVANHYELSPRLAHFLCPRGNHSATKPAPPPSSTNDSTFEEAKRLEAARCSQSSELAPTERTQEIQVDNFTDIVNALWHFCTVDFGRRYLCIGWNALFFLPSPGTGAQSSKPHAIRVWSSLLLCDDGTIVSVFEAPLNASSHLSRIRYNQVNVFRNLSRSYHAQSNAMMQVLVRPLRPKTDSSTQAAFEMASLLLYYLFDDWLNLFDQVSGSKHSYRHQLEVLRKDLMERPRQEQVNTLHQVGRQISALKSICRSYESIIERILHKQIVSQSRTRKGLMARPQIDTMDLQHYSTESEASTIRLSSSSIARFERLHDRIGLLLMTEVDECLNEKEALVLMNFNLISLTEAHTVERLTRMTILLAKVTIVFLPMSLATAYFSMQVKAVQNYSIETFWIVFLVVAVLTISFLATFEFLASRYSGKLAYRSLTKTLFDRRRKRD
jgi:Mg2+ and Co2+ transporter CorA